MSQKLRLAPVASVAAVIAMMGACGHITVEEDDITGTGGSNPTGTGGSNPTGTGGTGVSGSTNAGTGGSAGSIGGSGITGECGDQPSQQFDPKLTPGDDTPASDPAVDDVLAAMNLDQKILQMSGIPVGNKDYQDIERSPDVDLGGTIVRGYRYRDAAHGVNLDAGQDNRPKDANNFATAFPQSSIRGASWDLDLEWRLGEAMGDETAASKNNMLLGPCMNIIRHPYWGRTQETYGEDMYHIGRFAAAYTAGLQQHVAGCAKHYAANNVEQNRANQDAIMDEQTLREIYGRHFEMVARDGGIACVMASYNKINGVKSTQNRHLLTEILRNDFGYKGLVISDWWAMPGDQGPVDSSLAFAQAGEAAIAGLDIEVPWTLNFGQLGPAANANPDVATAINTAARRILLQKSRFKSMFSTDNWSKQGDSTLRSTMSGASIATNQGHLDLAEEAAVKSAVLLTNGLEGAAPVLPITGMPSMAIVGLDLPVNINNQTTPAKQGGTIFHMVTDVAVGDRGSSRVNADPAQSVGPFGGISAAGYAKGLTTFMTGTSAAEASTADVVVVVVGYTPGDEGEEYAIPTGGDRQSLDLPGAQNQLVNDVLTLDKPTVIIIQGGSIVNMPWLGHANKKQASIFAGYSGMRGGLAYGKLLFGDANFSGKMPMAWPKQEDLIPFKDQPNATTMGYFFGYRLYDKLAADGTPKQLVFPFGHGLSYTTFAYSNPVVPACATNVSPTAILDIAVDIENTGAVAGEEVALLFVKGPTYTGTGHRPVKELKSFTKVALAPTEKKTAVMKLRINDLRHWEGGANGSWVIDKGTYTVLVGKNGNEADLMPAGTFTIN